MEYASEIGLEYLRELLRNDIPISGIVCVGSEYQFKKNQLLLERTGGNYDRPNFAEILQDSHIPMYIVEDIDGSYCLELIKNLNPELIVMESTRIIRSPIYKIPKIGMLNTHLAILPYMRGCSCVEWAILHDQAIGATCHFVIKSVDAGPIVERVQLNYNNNDSYELIRTKGIYLQAYTMVRGVCRVLNEEIDFKSALTVKKGPWFSPMREEEKINKVREKLQNGFYAPNPINDKYPISLVDISAETGIVSAVSQE